MINSTMISALSIVSERVPLPTLKSLRLTCRALRYPHMANYLDNCFAAMRGDIAVKRRSIQTACQLFPHATRLILKSPLKPSSDPELKGYDFFEEADLMPFAQLRRITTFFLEAHDWEKVQSQHLPFTIFHHFAEKHPEIEDFGLEGVSEATPERLLTLVQKLLNLKVLRVEEAKLSPALRALLESKRIELQVVGTR